MGAVANHCPLGSGGVGSGEWVVGSGEWLENSGQWGVKVRNRQEGALGE